MPEASDSRHRPAQSPDDLTGWLAYIEQIHPKSIELGLGRVLEVKDRLDLAFSIPIVTVAGTNGKGSACAMLDSILRAAGYRVGLYTSPHLLRYNERIRVNALAIADADLCRAFARVEAARAGVTLTYFEFGTLAAWVAFADAALDALVLEVGMGGRLDAVNALDSDCAVVTSIGIDHTDYLGGSRGEIGLEKAGIFRAGRPAIVTDASPPASLVGHARTLGADLQCIGRDFGYLVDGEQWTYWGRRGRQAGLPYPALRGACQLGNACACLATVDVLAERLPVDVTAVRKGLASVQWPGRFQVLPGHPAVILDVAHNPQATAELAKNLDAMGIHPATHAVLGMLGDKDIAAVCRAMRGRVSNWYAATLHTARGASASVLARAILSTDPSAEVAQFESPLQAYAAACRRAGEDDRIIVFGSFHTVADVMAARASLAN